MRSRFVFALLLMFSVAAFAQQRVADERPRAGAQGKQAQSGESSSRDTQIDLSPPAGDRGSDPHIEAATGVTEMSPWDPHKASKSNEVGDYYFKRKNYRAAESRYREALHWKSNDAHATFGLAQTLEKLGRREEARASYEAYLKLLPNGPRADEARAAVERLK